MVICPITSRLPVGKPTQSISVVVLSKTLHLPFPAGGDQRVAPPVAGGLDSDSLPQLWLLQDVAYCHHCVKGFWTSFALVLWTKW